MYSNTVAALSGSDPWPYTLGVILRSPDGSGTRRPYVHVFARPALSGRGNPGAGFQQRDCHASLAI